MDYISSDEEALNNERTEPIYIHSASLSTFNSYSCSRELIDTIKLEYFLIIISFLYILSKRRIKNNCIKVRALRTKESL